VTFFDWEPRSLPIVAFAARRQGLSPAALVTGDWREPPPLGPFDRIFAADVLYEARNLEPVAAFLARHLATDGEAWLADPGRAVAAPFEGIAAAEGLVPIEARPLSRPDGGSAGTLRRLALRERP
jgi:hypothetical protein